MTSCSDKVDDVLEVARGLYTPKYEASDTVDHPDASGCLSASMRQDASTCVMYQDAWKCVMYRDA